MELLKTNTVIETTSDETREVGVEAASRPEAGRQEAAAWRVQAAHRGMRVRRALRALEKAIAAEKAHSTVRKALHLLECGHPDMDTWTPTSERRGDHERKPAWYLAIYAVRIQKLVRGRRARLLAAQARVEVDEPAWLKDASEQLEKLLDNEKQQGERKELVAEPLSISKAKTIRRIDEAVPMMRVALAETFAQVAGGHHVRPQEAGCARKGTGGRQSRARRLERQKAEEAALYASFATEVRQAMAESKAYAESVATAEALEQRRLRAEVEEARQVEAALRASQADEDCEDDALRLELCTAAGLAPGDYCGWAADKRRVEGQAEERLFRRRCKAAGVRADGTARLAARRSRVQEAVKEAEAYLASRFGEGWRHRLEQNIASRRQRYDY